MQTYRIQCTIEITAYSDLDAVKEFHDFVRDNVHFGFSNGQVLNVEELLEEN